MSQGPGAKFRLKVTQGNLAWDFSDLGSEFTVGRTEDASVALPIPNLSRVHLVFSRTGDGSWQCADRGSSNGTYLEGRRLEKGEKVSFADSIKLSVGRNVELSFKFENTADAAVTQIPTENADLVELAPSVDLPFDSAPDLPFDPPADLGEVPAELASSRMRDLKAEEAKLAERVTRLRDLDQNLAKEIQEIKLEFKKSVEQKAVFDQEIDRLRATHKKERDLQQLISADRLRAEMEIEKIHQALAEKRFESDRLQTLTQNLTAKLDDQNGELKKIQVTFIELKQQIQQLVLNRNDFSQKIEDLRTEKEICESEATLVKQRRDGLARELEDVREKVNAADIELKAAEVSARHHMDLAKGAEAMRQRAVEEESAAVERARGIESEIERLSSEAQSERTLRQDLADERQALEERVSEFKILRQEAERAVDLKKQALDAIILELDELWNKRDTRREELRGLEIEAEKFRDIIRRADESEQRCRALAIDEEKSSARLQDMNRQLAALELSLQKLASNEVVAQQSLDLAQRKVQSAQSEYEALEAQRRRSETALESLKAEVLVGDQRLQRCLQDIQNAEQKNKTLALNLERDFKAHAAVTAELAALRGEQASEVEILERARAAAKTEIQDWDRSERLKLKQSFIALAEKQELELAKRRKTALEAIETEKAAWTKEQAQLKPTAVKQILKASGDLFAAHVGQCLAPPHDLEKLQGRYMKDVSEAVKTVLGSANEENNVETTTHLRSLLALAPGAGQGAKDYWKKRGVQVGAFAAVLLLLAVVPAIPRAIVSGTENLISRSPASDDFVERVRQARANRPKFLPQQDRDYRASYTENLIYLLGYSELKVDESIKKDWTLKLNKFLQKNLELDDRVIVNFLGIEAPLVDELLRLREKIKPETQVQDIARMKDFEALTTPRLVQALGGQANYQKVREFEAEFYSQFSKNFDSASKTQ